MGAVPQAVGRDDADVPAVVEGSAHGQDALAVPSEVEGGEPRRQDRPGLQPERGLDRCGAAHRERLDADRPQGPHQRRQEPGRPGAGQGAGGHDLVERQGGAVAEVVVEVLGALGKQALERVVVDLPDQRGVPPQLQALVRSGR